MKFLTKDRAYYKMAIRLIPPIALQNMLFLVVNLLDTIMLGRLGAASETAINAANLANQPFFVYSLFIFGTVSGSAVLISQYWGKNDLKAINSVAGISIIFTGAVGILVSVAIILFPKQILSVFSQDAEVIRRGAEYLGIIVWCYIPTSLSLMLSGIMRSVEKVQCALLANIIGLSVNVILNYGLIFGRLGLPRMEVRGAALATVIARCCELLFVLYYVFIHDKQLRLRLSKMFSIPKSLVKDFISISMPVVCNETAWSVGITMYSVIIGNLGTSAYAAYTVAGIIERLALVFSQGFASAGAVIIGKTIGRGEPDKAYEYGKTTLFLSAVSSVVLGVAIMLIRHSVISFFDISDEAKEYAGAIILVMSFLIITKGYNLTSIVGVLRGGGDTRFVLLLDVIPLWVVALPAGFLFAYVFELPVHIVYSAFFYDEIVKMIIGMKRFVSRKWIKDVTG